MLTDVLDPSERPGHVVAFLFDGTNSNVLYDMCARGEAPNVARLIEMGVAFGHGAMSSLPTVTLANHTSIITGAHPGHHGILNNAWFDRSTGEQVITNSQATWPGRCSTSRRASRSIHDAVHRTWPDAFTASVNEPCDIGADYLDLRLLPAGRGAADPEGSVRPPAHHRAVRAPVEGLLVVVGRRPHGRRPGARASSAATTGTSSYPMPRFMWCNFTLTDAAMHEGGPHSEMAAASVRDSDGRVGPILDALEQRGVIDDCAFVLVADHGMEENDPDVPGRLGRRPRARPVSKARDEAYSFLYLGT